MVVRVGEVFADDAGHIDSEGGQNEAALTQDDFAGGRFHGAAVVIEKIAGGPADDTLRGIEEKRALLNGRLRQEPIALEGKAGSFPCESALERLHMRVASGPEFFRRGGGFERPSSGAVNDDGCRNVRNKRLDLVGERHP